MLTSDGMRWMLRAENNPPVATIPPVLSTARAIIRQIESLGYKVSVHQINGVIEMHAVLLADPSADNIHLARNVDGNGEAEIYSTACALAEMVGIEIGE